MADQPIALIDLDGTLADYDLSMREELKRLCSPEESTLLDQAPNLHLLEKVAPFWKERMDLIKTQPGWWFHLPPIERNFKIVEAMRELGFSLNILTKGPWSKSVAWAEKVEWAKVHVPDAEVHITGSQTGKGMVYGKVLFDDHPPYLESWLEYRPRGLAIMPLNLSNQDFNHPQVVHWDGTGEALNLIREKLSLIQ